LKSPIIEYRTNGVTTSTPAPVEGETTTTAGPADVSFRVRVGTVQDHDFVYATWLRAFRTSAFAHGIRTSVYFAGQHRRVATILARPGTTVLIAAPDGDDLTILGYAVIEGHTVHWVHVKEAFRRFGLARALLAGLPETFRFSHRIGGLVESLIREHAPHAIYDPYLSEETQP
jgi:hypothetical protein